MTYYIVWQIIDTLFGVKIMKRTAFVLLILAIFFLTACGEKALNVSDAWARPSTSGGNSAIYLVIDNPTSSDDVLLSASSTIAAAIELHMSTMDADGIMSMQPLANVPVAAGSQVTFQPGGLHIMLIDLNEDLIIGEYFSVTLHFQTAGDLTLEVPIQEP